MKISPVVGTPTIPNLSPTGLSPEKLAAVKALAMGQPKPEAPHEETIQLGETPTSATQRIKMNVNRSHTLPIEQPEAPKAEENAPPLEAKEPAAVEAPVVVSDKDVQAQPEPKAIGTVSPELAELAKQRRALQLEREQLAKDKEALQGQSAESLIKRLKANALSVLQEHGVTYEQLTNEILGQSQQPQLDLTKVEEQILKKVQDRLAEKDTQQEEAVYAFMEQEVEKLSNLVPYKLIRETKSQGKVMDLVKRMWREKGEILSESEAMDLIESELREDAKRYAKLLGELEPTTPPAETQPVQATAQTKAPKTLTNKDSARPVMTRRQRAIAAALGQK